MQAHTVQLWWNAKRLAATAVTVVLGFSIVPVQASNNSEDLVSLTRSVIATYATIVDANYQDTIATATALADSIEAFVADPSAAALNRARRAWVEARVPYTQTEAFRFYDGPIEAVEGLINSWPIDENLIDYVDGQPDAGIINKPHDFPRITDDLLVTLNEKDGEKNITAGFHAIEFLLWGQDLNEQGPGDRSYTDYLDADSPHAARRREYLRLASRLLVKNLESVAVEWAPNSTSNYRARFVGMPVDEALASILKGIGILSGADWPANA